MLPVKYYVHSVVGALYLSMRDFVQTSENSFLYILLQFNITGKALFSEPLFMYLCVQQTIAVKTPVCMAFRWMQLSTVRVQLGLGDFFGKGIVKGKQMKEFLSPMYTPLRQNIMLSTLYMIWACCTACCTVTAGCQGNGRTQQSLTLVVISINLIQYYDMKV